jgi:hypothetical protein
MDLSAVYRDPSRSPGSKAALAAVHLVIVGWVLWVLSGLEPGRRTTA